MNMVKAFLSSLFLIGAADQGMAATQIVSGGLLTGAIGVLVNGKSYDLQFVEGTCASVFGTCAASAFPFSDLSSATEAVYAIDYQVWLNTELGDFDVYPNKTYGCSSEYNCIAYVPYRISVNGAPIYTVSAVNSSPNGIDQPRLQFNTNTSVLGV